MGGYKIGTPEPTSDEWVGFGKDGLPKLGENQWFWDTLYPLLQKMAMEIVSFSIKHSYFP